MNAVYHVFNRSIARYKIFNNNAEYMRMTDALDYYQLKKPPQKFSLYRRMHPVSPGRRTGPAKGGASPPRNHRSRRIRLIAYCLMPTHFHLLVEETKEESLPRYTSDVLNSYSRYFNLRHKRQGPLWQGRTRKVLVDTDEVLLHVTRYIHLNPVTAHLVDYPEEWRYSSYREYIERDRPDSLCQFDHIVDINPGAYKTFVEDQVGYQRELSRIKKAILE